MDGPHRACSLSKWQSNRETWKMETNGPRQKDRDGLTKNTGGLMESEKEDSEMACSTLLATTTTCIFLVKSDKFPWPPPVSSLNWPAPRMLPEHIPWNFPCSRAHRYFSQYLSHQMIVTSYSFLNPPRPHPHPSNYHQHEVFTAGFSMPKVVPGTYQASVHLFHEWIRQRQREKVEKLTSQRPRGKAQGQNESPPRVKSNIDLQTVTVIQQCW